MTRLRIKLTIFALLLAVTALTLVNAQQQQTPQKYTEADMPKLMDATWSENVIGEGTDPETIKSLLQRGQIIIINEHPKRVKWLITSGVLVNASPETIFKAIKDYENYPNFMPETENVTAKELNGPNIVELSMTLNIKVMKGISLPVKYSIIHYHRPPLRSDWTKSTGKFEENSGFYQFVPVDGGKQTMLFYTIYTLPRIPIATDLFKKDPNLELVINMSTAVMVCRALKKHVEKLEGRQPFVPMKSGDIVSVLSKDPKTVNLLLKRGGLILLEEGPPMWATTAVAMNQSPEEVFKIITDFESYNCYQSQIVKTEVKSRTPTNAKVAFAMEIDYALLKIPLKYTLNYTFNPPTTISWKWAEGDVPSQQGSWTLIPLEGGKRTLAFFRQTEDLKSLPGLGGAGVRSAIAQEPTLEPAILGSQALIAARSTRDLINMPPAKRDELMTKCKKK